MQKCKNNQKKGKIKSIKSIAYRNKIIEGLESLFREESIRLSNKFTNEVFFADHITECPRRIIYRSMGEIGKDNSSFLKSISKNLLCQKWIDFYKKNITLVML